MAMLREAAMPSFGGALFAEYAGTAIVVELARLNGRPDRSDETSCGRLSSSQMRRLESYVCEHLPGQLTLGELALQLGMSVRYLSRALKRTKGVNVYRWIVDCRISEAHRLLRQTDLLIPEIARQCAFANAMAFSTAFRAAFGVAPDEFRRLAWGHPLTNQ
jgi:AraC family transcriptional regulator